jgi:hydroxymethyl cephem carbamoyltransferase
MREIRALVNHHAELAVRAKWASARRVRGGGAVNARQNPLLHRLLSKFRSLTHFGVLCNTSLNFNGTGFINRTSDLVRYAANVGLDGFAIDGVLFSRDPRRSTTTVTV